MIEILHSMDGLSTWLLRVNLQFSLLVVVVGVTTFGLRRVLAAHWRSLLWLIAFARLVLPVGPASRFSVQNVWRPTADSAVSARSYVATVGPLRAHDRSGVVDSPLHHGTVFGPAPASVESGARTILTPQRLVLIAWSFVAAILLFRLVWRSVDLARWLNRLARIDDAELLSLVEQCSKEVGIRRAPAVAVAPIASGPAIGGWFRPVLLLPTECLSRLSAAQLRLVILHELRHVRTGDLVIGWLLHVIVALHWFNPLVWLACRCWIGEREMACDAWILAHTGTQQRRCYGETLVAVIELVGHRRPLTMTAGMVAFPSLIERRIRAMTRPAPKPIPTFVCGGLAAVLVGLCGLTDGIQAQNTEPERVAPQATTQPAAAPRSVAAENEDSKPKPQRVKLTFAKQVILWGSEEIVTWDEVQKRLEARTQQGPVRAQLFFTQGWALKSPDDMNDRMKEIIDAAPKDWSATFVSLRGSERLDRVEDADDLIPDPSLRRTGQVLLPDASGAAAKAQIVIIPAAQGCDLYLRGTTLRDPEDELWTATDANGNFAIHPDVEDYSVAIVHESGFGLFSGPIAPDGAHFQLKPWAELTFTATGADDELAEVWVRPAGSDQASCGFNLGGVRSNEKAVTRKVPPGRIHVSQVVNMNDGSYILGAKQPMFRLSAGESKSIALDPLSEDQRSEVKKRHAEQRAASESQGS